MFWTSRYGNKIYNNVWVSCLQFKVDNIPAEARPWTWDNPSTEYPRMYANATDNTMASDRFIEDGSFLRLKTCSWVIQCPRTSPASSMWRNSGCMSAARTSGQ